MQSGLREEMMGTPQERPITNDRKKEVIPIMKKRTYRSVPVKKLKVEKLSEEWRDARLVFGVDAAKETFFGALMDEEKRVRQIVKWDHLSESREIVELLSSLPVSSLEVAMEPTGTYGDPLRGLFEAQEVGVHLVSAKRVRDAREVFDGVPSSHDAKSASIIARLHLDGASKRWEFAPAEERELRAAVDLMRVYDSQKHNNLNRIEAKLARHWPELTSSLSLTSQTLVALLSEYGSAQEVAREPEGARALMRSASHGALKQEKIEAVIASASSTLGVAMVAAEVEYVKGVALEVMHNRGLSREEEKRVAALSASQPAVCRMAAEVGTGTAAAVVSYAGDAAGYSCPSSYLKGLGLNLKEDSSGKRQGELSITKRGPGVARWYLYLAVWRWIRKDGIARRYYDRKVARDGGKKSKAMTAMMRKLAQGLWHVARGEAFDSRKLFDLSRLGLSPE
jgi:transposase